MTLRGVAATSVRRVCALLGLATALLVITGSQASAQASVGSGWWTTAPVAVAPDAPSDGLVVQGGPDESQPFAFAAVSYTGASDATPSALKLTVASGSATTPGASLAVCPLTTAGFTPAHGGGEGDAPKYDCASKVTASASSDGATYTFDVASLAKEDGLAVAVVPTAATDRMVFQRPDESSFEVVGTTTHGSSTSGDSSSELNGSDANSTAAEGSPGVPSTSASNVSLPSPSVGAAGGGTPGAQPAQAAPSGGSDSSGTLLQATPAGSTDTRSGWTRLRGLLFVALALAAAGLWSAAGSQERPLVSEPND